MFHARWIACFALASAVAVSGCRDDGQTLQSKGDGTAAVASLTIPSGTSLEVTLNTTIDSKTASVGDSWTGSVRNSPVLDSRAAIPVGSVVSGTVTGVKPAKKGDRAMLDLGLTSITVADHSYPADGSTEAIIAGSTRARNLGAIAGSAAGGALIGKAVTGTGKGALVGAVVGGGVATGVVAASEGFQVVLKPGTALTFTTSEAIAVRQ
jgi:hypothetical protein